VGEICQIGDGGVLPQVPGGRWIWKTFGLSGGDLRRKELGERKTPSGTPPATGGGKGGTTKSGRGAVREKGSKELAVILISNFAPGEQKGARPEGVRTHAVNAFSGVKPLRWKTKHITPLGIPLGNGQTGQQLDERGG